MSIVNILLNIWMTIFIVLSLVGIIEIIGLIIKIIICYKENN